MFFISPHRPGTCRALTRILAARLCAALALLVVGAEHIQAQSAQKPKALRLAPLLGKDFAAYERVLGEAAKRKSYTISNFLAESRTYSLPKFQSVKLVEVYSPERQGYVSEVELLFPRGTFKHWKAALGRVGLSPVDVQEGQDKGYISLTSKTGKWTAYWIPRSPDYQADALIIYLRWWKSTKKATAVPASKTPNFFALQGKSLAEYEAALGKPRVIQEDRAIGYNGVTREQRFYKAAGLTRVILYVADKPDPIVSTVEIQFPKAALSSWQEALARIGYSTAGVLGTPHPNGYTLLKNIPGLLGNGQEWIEDGAGEHAGDSAERNNTGTHRLSLFQDLTAASNSDNLLKGAVWKHNAFGGAEGRFAEFADVGADAGNGYSFTTTKVGPFEYNAQFSPLISSLENGRTYTLSFEARADPPGEMIVLPELYNSPYLPVGLSLQTIRPGREWQTWSYTFIARNGDRGQIKMPAFRRGISKGTVWVRSVSLKVAGAEK